MIGPAGIRAVTFSPDGSQIASGSRDRVLQLWNADTGKNLFSKSGTHQINLSCVQFSPDGRRIVSSGGHTVTLWDVDTAREILMLTERSRVREVRFSPDGQQIAGSMDDGTVIIWSAR